MKTTNTTTGNDTAKHAKIIRVAPLVVIDAAPAVTSLSAINSAIIHRGEADVGAFPVSSGISIFSFYIDPNIL
jgi:hypothetical protein